MLIGGAIYGYIIGSITTVCSSVDAQRKAYYDRMDLIQAYMNHHGFPAPLRYKVRAYFKRYFNMRSALDEKAILNDLDPELRQEVGAFLLHDVVRQNAIFAKLSAAVLARVVLVLKVGRSRWQWCAHLRIGSLHDSERVRTHPSCSRARRGRSCSRASR